jgi:hypothetical protein
MKTHFCKWSLEAVHDGILDPELTFFTDEAWSHLSGYISTQNRYLSSINLRQTSEVPIHDWRNGVWCAVTATRIVGPMFLFKHLFNSRQETF